MTNESQTCAKCGGLIMEPMRGYGYAGKVCLCDSPLARAAVTPVAPAVDSEDVRKLVEAAEDVVNGASGAYLTRSSKEIDVEDLNRLDAALQPFLEGQ